MKDTTVMEIAVRELTGAVNQIAQHHQIPPSLMRFVVSAVSNKLNEMAITELSEEVASLELKIGEPISVVGKESDKKESNEVENNKNIDSKTKVVKKNGNIQDLIADLKKSGVKVTETRHSFNPETGEEIIEDVPYEPKSESDEVKK